MGDGLISDQQWRHNVGGQKKVNKIGKSKSGGEP